jgi:hypothetical protein
LLSFLGVHMLADDSPRLLCCSHSLLSVRAVSVQPRVGAA